MGTLSWRRKPGGYQFAWSPWIETQRQQTVAAWTALVITGRGEVASNCRRHLHARKQRRIEKTTNVMVVQVQRPPRVANLVDINRHGSLGKLLRVTAWVLCFIKNACPNQDETVKRKGTLKREELIQAEGEWLKATHAELRRQGNFQQLVSELGLVEKDRILRCVGRLEVDARGPETTPTRHW